MRIVLIGATGLLGSAIHAALAAQGHTVVATYHRRAPRMALPGTEWRALDIATARTPRLAAVLQGADAVVNCAGVLQDNAWDRTGAVHVAGVEKLVQACADSGVRRVIHFSAIGADRHTPTDFSRSKRAGEEILGHSGLDWVILRPSMVVGDGAFGGSALMRGLAALPLLPVMPDTASLAIVQRSDVARTVLFFLKDDAPARIALDLAGPQPHRMTEVVALYRAWLGWPPAREIPLPRPLAALLYRLGDFARALGWRPPLGSTARREMVYGATGDPAPWTAVTGILPQGLEEALARRPASVQERWFARLYLLKPVLFTVFALFWIATGIISLTIGYETGVDLMLQAGAGALAGPSVIAGAIADLTVGFAIAFRRTTRQGLYGGLGLTLFYVLAGSMLTPWLWADPLGPLLKIWPIMALNLVLLNILEER